VAATRDDWKTTPLPARREAITLDRTYSANEFERLRAGHIPGRMEDKWFAFFEEPWLYLHRSWTGYCVYQVRFEPAAGGSRVAEALVSRDPEQYRGTDATRDALLLAVLLDRYAGRDTKASWEQYRASLR
jgi:8-oxo-dGTP diphosphatase